MNVIEHEVVVVGLGAFGSSALWRLAVRGVDVAGVDQFAIPHAFGSTHGTTRLFRVACLEHPNLSVIAKKSLELWRSLENATGEVLVRQTGCLNCGPTGREPVQGTVEASRTAGLEVDMIDHDDLLARYPNMAGWGSDDVGVWDSAAGICYPERILSAQIDAARRLGAKTYFYTHVTDIDLSERQVTIVTPTAIIRAARIVVAAGAWLGKLLPALPLVPRRTPLYWFRTYPGAEDAYTIDKLPAFIRELPSGIQLWGHGSSEEFQVKIGMMDLGSNFTDADPDLLDRYVHQREDISELAFWVASALPGIDPTPDRVIACMVTNSPDKQFLVGPYHRDDRVVIAGGDSAHGFKHAGGVGELVADSIVGAPSYCDATFLEPARFESTVGVSSDD